MNNARRILTLLALLVSIGGCESGGSTSYHVSTGYYSGPGWYNPYYGGCCYGDVDIDVHPPPRPRPPGDRPARPSHQPSIPSRPRPMPRGGGRRR